MPDWFGDGLPHKHHRYNVDGLKHGVFHIVVKIGNLEGSPTLLTDQMEDFPYPAHAEREILR